jgi:hypothetical protein
MTRRLAAILHRRGELPSMMEKDEGTLRSNSAPEV